MKKIDENLIHEESPKMLWIRNHVEFWMSKIFGNVEIRTIDNGFYAGPSIEFHDGNDWVLPTHVGFGLSYVLPIILALLCSRSGDVFIIDSPEAHLHPAAQTTLAMFLSFIASKNRTIIIETHSDHIVDGIRLSCVKGIGGYSEKIIENKNVKILFFDEDHSYEDILVRSNGKLSKWPRGFFDQALLNLRALSGR